jgi:hypothetical protein
MKKVLLLAAVAAMTASTVVAHATTQFDQNLTAGWIDGTSANPNGGFTTDTENGIQLGLRAKLRQSPNVIDSSTDVYNVPVGAEIGVPTRASWNYEFSMNVTSGSLLTDYTETMVITDVTTGATATVNPLTYWNDDSGGKVTLAQNSENPAFSDFPLVNPLVNTAGPLGYNMNALDEYEFNLSVTDISTGLGASDTIFVNVVPTPLPSAAGMGLGMFGVIAAAGLLRKKLRTA